MQSNIILLILGFIASFFTGVFSSIAIILYKKHKFKKSIIMGFIALILLGICIFYENKYIKNKEAIKTELIKENSNEKI